ncbi:MAG: endonuclease domain-containing protein [Caulobacteraceae bacterium]
MSDSTTPFPLEGGRAGDGGGGPSARAPHGPVSGGVGRARYLRREMTHAERMLWTALRQQKMNFRRQAPIGRYIADFVHHASKLVIEVDGPLHDTLEAREHDLKRTAWLNAEGYRVIRFSEDRVRNDLFAVVDEIVAATAPPPSPALPPSRGKGDARYLVR